MKVTVCAALIQPAKPLAFLSKLGSTLIIETTGHVGQKWNPLQSQFLLASIPKFDINTDLKGALFSNLKQFTCIKHIFIGHM